MRNFYAGSLSENVRLVLWTLLNARVIASVLCETTVPLAQSKLIMSTPALPTPAHPFTYALSIGRHRTRRLIRLITSLHTTHELHQLLQESYQLSYHDCEDGPDCMMLVDLPPRYVVIWSGLHGGSTSNVRWTIVRTAWSWWICTSRVRSTIVGTVW